MAYQDEVILKYRVDGAGTVVAANKQISDSLKGLTQQATTQVKSSGQLLTDSGDAMISWGKNTQWLGRQLLYNVSLPIAGVAAGAVKLALDFDESMSRVRAAASEAGNIVSMQVYEQMKKSVVDLSKTTIKSAQEISDGFYELVSAGYSVEESMKMLSQVTEFAVAGTMGVGEAASFATRMLHAWGDTGISLQEIMDVTSVAVQKSQAHFSDFTHNIEMSSQFAKQANLSYQDLAVAMMILSDRGAPLARIGFNISQMFTQMIKPSDAAKDVMDELHLSYYDLSGTMKPMGQILDEIRDKTAGLNDERKAEYLNILFNIRAGRAVLSLIQGTTEQYVEYEKKIRSATGATKTMAQAQIETYSGSFKIAINQIKAAGIELGNKLLPILTKFINEALIPLINWLMKLNPETQKWIGIIAGVVAAMGPALIVLASFAQVIGLIEKVTGKTITGVLNLSNVFGKLKSSTSLLLLPGNAIVGVMDKLVKVAPVLGANMGTLGGNFSVWKTVILQVITSLKTLVLTTIPTFIKNLAMTEVSIKGITTALGGLKTALLGIRVPTNVAFTIITAAAIAAYAIVKSQITKLEKDQEAAIKSQSLAQAMEQAYFNRDRLKEMAKRYGLEFTQVWRAYIDGTLGQLLQDTKDKYGPLASELGRMLTEGITQGLTEAEVIAKLQAGGAQIPEMLLQTLVSQTANAEGAGAALTQAVAVGLGSGASLAAIKEHTSLVTSEVLAKWVEVQLQSVPAGTLLSQMLGAGISAPAALGALQMAGQTVNTTVLEEIARAQPKAEWLGKMLDEAVKQGIINEDKRKEIEAAMSSVLDSSLKVCAVNAQPTAEQTGKSLWDSVSTGWKIASAMSPLITLGTIIYKAVKKEYQGGLVSGGGGYRGGLISKMQSGGFIPGSSALRDRTPIMATPGEGIMSKNAIERFLQTGEGAGGTTINYNIEIKPGTMIATPGEIRYFAREIKRLIKEDEARTASPGAAFTGMKTANIR